ncbi:MAG TPA: septum site-determining protein MinC [Roseiarcus sp.]|jgi:septum site-determining protein MinC|nr:septum site-determining protein MinC [Roseiarcus sp.]
MNAHATPAQALNFRARSLLAFVLEPTQPVVDWFAALDAWLVRSPTFFASKPVILEMAGIELGLQEYRNLLSGLALRHIRVMGVDNAGQSLVGPHLPPVVTGGRNVNAPVTAEESAPAASEPETTAKIEKAESLIVDGNVRSGQSIMHPDGDVTIVGRVASGAEIVAGGSVHVYGALQGRVIAGISGSSSARIFCNEARAELICIGGVYVTAEQMNPEVEGRRLEARLDGDELKLRVLD